jgi:hypothetical protein
MSAANYVCRFGFIIVVASGCSFGVQFLVALGRPLDCIHDVRALRPPLITKLAEALGFAYALGPRSRGHPSSPPIR